MAEPKNERLLAVLAALGETLVQIERAIERARISDGAQTGRYMLSSRQVFAERVEEAARQLTGDLDE